MFDTERPLWRGNFDLIRQKTLVIWEWNLKISVANGLQAWDLYMTKNYNTKDGMIMLQLIAIECYRIGEYWTAAKAFDMLEKFSIDPNPEYWEGKVNYALLKNDVYKFNRVNNYELIFLIIQAWFMRRRFVSNISPLNYIREFW